MTSPMRGKRKHFAGRGQSTAHDADRGAMPGEGRGRPGANQDTKDLPETSPSRKRKRPRSSFEVDDPVALDEPNRDKEIPTAEKFPALGIDLSCDADSK